MDYSQLVQGLRDQVFDLKKRDEEHKAKIDKFEKRDDEYRAELKERDIKNQAVIDSLRAELKEKDVKNRTHREKMQSVIDSLRAEIAQSRADANAGFA